MSATANGFYFFQFKTLAFMEEVIEEGPWLFQGQPVVLQAWEQGMSLRRQKHMQVPVWIHIHHLPMEYLTEDGLSAVASGIGTPLYTDKITKNCLRMDFARVCVMLDYQSKLPKHLVVISSILREGKELPIKVDIQYEWLSLRCKQCCSLGHNTSACPDTRLKKQAAPVAVFVQKQQSTVVDSLHKRVRWLTRVPKWRRMWTFVRVDRVVVILGSMWMQHQPHIAKISPAPLVLQRVKTTVELTKVKR
ncbi:UNVERIFIED_CONTAM: hypothetical protein Slati_0880300 [Sesamum latifolium]|uniref:DUF4283 domain-containing protein n=1 Tax=Sesamum latifolium TaxID=2727402 RepID=A0AAW2XSY9_9LAMI